MIRLMKPTKIVLDLLTRAAMYNIVGRERRLICQFNGGDSHRPSSDHIILVVLLYKQYAIELLELYFPIRSNILSHTRCRPSKSPLYPTP